MATFHVQKQSKHFTISLLNQQYTFNFIWLRDNCGCSKCVFIASQQKVFSCVTIPLDIHPLRFGVDEGELSVAWSDGHESRYSHEWLHKNSYSTSTLQERRLQLKPSLWKAQDIVQHSTDYVSFMQDDSSLLRMLRIFLDFGIIFITGVPPPNPNELSITPVEKVIARIGPLRETFYGRFFDVINVAEPKNIAYTATRLELHQDLVYFESVPPVQLLHCVIQSKLGGENVFVDSYLAAERLKENSPHHFETLLRVPVTFQHASNGHNFSCQKPVLYKNENQYIGVNYSPHSHGPLKAPPSDIEPFYTAFAELSKLIHTEDLMLTKKLAPGELVMFDNRRVLHGRASYSPGEARHLQGAYLGMDEVSDRYNVLKWQIEKQK